MNSQNSFVNAQNAYREFQNTGSYSAYQTFARETEQYAQVVNKSFVTASIEIVSSSTSH